MRRKHEIDLRRFAPSNNAMNFADVQGFVKRHRTVVRDLLIILAGLLVALYCAYAFDLVQEEGHVSPVRKTIEVDEALLIGVMLGVALLAFSLRQYRGQRREIARRVAAEQHARDLAYQDGLTGLPNRRQYEEALTRALATQPVGGAGHAVFLLDLNGFKKINDVYGHGVGDEVLGIVGQRLRTAMRGHDMVARFGGDEFAVLAMNLGGPEAATNVALRVIDALGAPIDAAGATHRVGAGVGIALIPNDASTLEEAMRKADIALYRAKAERRSALRFFEPEMDTRVRGRAAMESALRDALEHDRIETLFRPTVHLDTQRIIGFEAIPNWIDPEAGEVPLERFVAIAEEAGLIHALAERTLFRAAQAAKQWPEHISLAVDVYPGQLRDAQLSTRTLDVLVAAGIAPGRLELQISESALIADVEAATQCLSPLRSAGVRIALDNFGTGYSSLRHLRNFGVDKIKIDGSFVRGMNAERESAGIVQALIGLGHGFGLTIAADGVDNPAQSAALVSGGCELGQGGLFSERLSAEAAVAMFRDTGAAGTEETVSA